MKRVVLFAVIISATLVSCLKTDNVCSRADTTIFAPANEVADVQAYLTANGIVATKHPTGFFYVITTPGTGTVIANLCSNLTVKYKGKLTNGTIFDETAPGTTATFGLGGVILGWQKGMPLINEGGSIKLYIPPTLGYGAQAVPPTGTPVIPANSILIFEIDLVGVANL